jgi:hypothetical protein
MIMQYCPVGRAAASGLSEVEVYGLQAANPIPPGDVPPSFTKASPAAEAMAGRDGGASVMNRGDQREAIFKDDQDRQKLLATLGETRGKTDWQIHAYCLIPRVRARSPKHPCHPGRHQA